jgi:hypothetical protein
MPNDRVGQLKYFLCIALDLVCQSSYNQLQTRGTEKERRTSWAGEDWYSSRPWTRLARSRINGHDNESPIPTKPERRIRLIKPIQDGLGALQITIGGEPHNYRLLALAIAFVPI